MSRVLVVDDKPNFRRLFEEILGAEFAVVTAKDANEALARLEVDRFDVVVSDVRMPGKDGFALLSEIKSRQPDTAVILVTGYGSVGKAVEAMKQGAFHFLTKPFEPEQILGLVRAAAAATRPQGATTQETAPRLGGLIGQSAAMKRVFDLIERAARTDATVLLTGGSGTGKELAARAIHAASARRDGPFTPVHCGALPESLVEAELFGHDRGAFTGATEQRKGLFEATRGGTILLDEIGEVPPDVQVKLTRVLQEHAVRRVGGTKEQKLDIRVIASTLVDLTEAVAERRFREDLYYRLNVFPIRLPTLAERREDIGILAAHFIAQIDPDRTLSAGAIEALTAAPWPGNVRELENVIARAAAISDDAVIGADDLVGLAARPGGSSGAALAPFKAAMASARDDAALAYLSALLEQTRGNVTQAANIAEVERESLHRLLRKHGLSPRTFRDRDIGGRDT